MLDLDSVEKRLADLGVNVYDIKERDAYMRCVILLDRCENKISNLTVALQEAEAKREKTVEEANTANVRHKCMLDKLLNISRIVSKI